MRHTSIRDDGAKESLPIIGITMGDPAGIGPELCVKALGGGGLYSHCNPLVVGDSRMLEIVAQAAGYPQIKFNRIKSLAQACFEEGTIDVLHSDLIELKDFQYGEVSAKCGEAAYRSVEQVIDLALCGEVDATVTNALSKEAINLAGHHFSGHTEIYARLTGTETYTMMLVYRDFRVVHVSTHVSLRQACDLVKRKRVFEVIQIGHQACLDLGIKQPRIAVAGLNPHSGENGLFGLEEIEEIIPAIADAKEEGICADGPIPPDTVFSKAIGGWYDLVVCMYHDQGHIPIKVKGFVYNRDSKSWEAVEGVNVTLGLPIIRTSVDHGTGFDIAGKGEANELSLLQAVRYAILLANTKMHAGN